MLWLITEIKARTGNPKKNTWTIKCWLAGVVRLFSHIPNGFEYSNKRNRISFEVIDFYHHWLHLLFFFASDKLRNIFSKFFLKLINRLIMKVRCEWKDRRIEVCFFFFFSSGNFNQISRWFHWSNSQNSTEFCLSLCDPTVSEEVDRKWKWRFFLGMIWMKTSHL